MRAQFVDTVSKLIKNDPKVVLLLGDIGVYSFRDLFKSYPLRTYNIGILEQSTISVAAGLSLTGFFPIVHTIAPFITERALEQIKVDLGYQQLSANLVSVGSSYDYAGLGSTHHCPSDVGILNEVPNLEIIVPGHKNEFDKIFSEIYNNKRTSYFRLSEYSNKKDYPVNFGKNLILKEGKKLAILVVGPMLQTVLDATNDLDVSIIYCTTVKPLDISFMSELETDKLLIIEPYYSGPLLSNIEENLGGINGYYKNIGVPKDFIRKYGTKEQIDKQIGLDKLSIRKKVLQNINE